MRATGYEIPKNLVGRALKPRAQLLRARASDLTDCRLKMMASVDSSITPKELCRRLYKSCYRGEKEFLEITNKDC